MALITCPECRGKVSDKAKACPHCGYPMCIGNTELINTIVEINGSSYDISDVIDMVINKNESVYAIKMIMDKSGADIRTAKGITDYIKEHKEAPKDLEEGRYVSPVKKDAKLLPHCPTCGSTNIKQLGVGTRAAAGAMFGLYSKTARCQFMCKNCKYKW